MAGYPPSGYGGRPLEDGESGELELKAGEAELPVAAKSIGQRSAIGEDEWGNETNASICRLSGDLSDTFQRYHK
jgi:hypothetical protein